MTEIALVGILIVWLFFGEQTPAPPATTTPTTTAP
jgi:hypothetical protein